MYVLNFNVGLTLIEVKLEDTSTIENIIFIFNNLEYQKMGPMVEFHTSHPLYTMAIRTQK